MTLRVEFLWLVLIVGAVAFACRAGGFLLMQFIPQSPRLEAALKATPLAVMVGIVAPSAARGGVSDILALGVIVGLARLGANDVVSALSGVAVVALARSFVG
jgi:uncharacterized membrane protein